MKKYLRLLFACILCAFAAAFAAPPDGQGYALVWSDEFDGPALDTNSWSFDVGGQIMDRITPYFSNGLNLTFENGSAVLWFKKENYSSWPYTSCRVNTKGKKEFKYGYMEIKLKASSGNGLVEAFWTMGSDMDVSGWPACGEIDLYAQRTGQQLYAGTPGDNCFYAGCYFKGASGGASYNSKQYYNAECLCSDYHLYAIEWDSLGIKYFFDGNKFWEYDTITASYNFASFHQPHFVTADIDLNFLNNLNDSILPRAMYMDYVRVYQKDAVSINNNAQKNVSPSLNLIDPQKANLKIYDLLGRSVGDYTDRIRLMKSVANVMNGASLKLPVGIYIARFSGGSRSISEKLVVTK
jgi:beta-glucanase (GH16 family)